MVINAVSLMIHIAKNMISQFVDNIRNMMENNVR